METVAPGKNWLDTLAGRQKQIRELLSKSAEEQKKLGYFHTLREICRQPQTWRETCELVVKSASVLNTFLSGVSSIILTGSGSSEYAGESVRATLQAELRCNCSVIGAGTLLTDTDVVRASMPQLMVSLARSGDSPESVAAVSLMLELEPETRHLVFTCNRDGALARTFGSHPNVHVIVLGENTNDESLVMTSSFSNLALSARFLGLTERPDIYRTICNLSADIAEGLLQSNVDALAQLAAAGFTRAVFLGSGCLFGAARETALKMLEMNAGRVASVSETYLGLRHGPMSFLDKNTVVICYLSSDRARRNYELDLLRELDQKQLGRGKVIVGESIPGDVLRNGDVAVECPGLERLGDANAVFVNAIAGQLLAFFRCLREGLRPDWPSQDNVINRVVQSFPLYHG
jgi:D-galactosamine 6-phosphate deaminase/isomerase